MIPCDALADRLPDVVHGRATWTDDEARHIAGCDGCAAEWRLVRAGSMLGRGTVLDHDAVATAVLARLRRPDAVPVRPRVPWSTVALGLAAAASIAFAVVWSRDNASVPSPAAPVVALLPELNALTEGELEQVLGLIEASVPGEAAGVRPAQMSDLTDDELERLLRSVEG